MADTDQKVHHYIVNLAGENGYKENVTVNCKLKDRFTRKVLNQIIAMGGERGKLIDNIIYLGYMTLDEFEGVEEDTND